MAFSMRKLWPGDGEDSPPSPSIWPLGPTPDHTPSLDSSLTISALHPIWVFLSYWDALLMPGFLEEREREKKRGRERECVCTVHILACCTKAKTSFSLLCLLLSLGSSTTIMWLSEGCPKAEEELEALAPGATHMMCTQGRG